MAINWGLMTEGVDLTGFGQGIARGIEQATFAKRRQEDIARQDLKDFESKFELDKVLDKDSGAIIEKFEELKPLQIEYTRLNNSNGSPSRLQELNTKIKSIKSNISTIYGESKANAALYRDYKNFGEKMVASGFDIPDDYLQTMHSIAKLPSSELSKMDIKSPMEFSFDASQDELSGVDKIVKAGAKADKITETGANKYTVDLEGDKIDITEDVIYKMPKPGAVMQLVSGSMDASNRIKNNATKAKASIIADFNLPDYDPNLSAEENTQNAIKKKFAQKAFLDIQALGKHPSFGEQGLNIEKPEDMPAELAFGYKRNYFNKEQVGTVVNNKELIDKLKLLDQKKKWANRAKSLDMLSQNLSMRKINQAMGIGKYLQYGGYEITPWMADFIDSTPYDFRGDLDRSRTAIKDMKGGSGAPQIIVAPPAKK
jgi:hypothetical protein